MQYSGKILIMLVETKLLNVLYYPAKSNIIIFHSKVKAKAIFKDFCAATVLCTSALSDYETKNMVFT
jgi:hypothetical protein